MKYGLLIKGNCRAKDVKNYMPECKPIKHSSPLRGDTYMEIESDSDLTIPLNEWFCKDLNPPYESGSLLYWYPVNERMK